MQGTVNTQKGMGINQKNAKTVAKKTMFLMYNSGLNYGPINKLIVFAYGILMYYAILIKRISTECG